MKINLYIINLNIGGIEITWDGIKVKVPKEV